MQKQNNVHLSKEEIDEILNALYLSINESQELDEDTNIELQDKLSDLRDSL
jgi:hypothetical protein